MAAARRAYFVTNRPGDFGDCAGACLGEKRASINEYFSDYHYADK